MEEGLCFFDQILIFNWYGRMRADGWIHKDMDRGSKILFFDFEYVE